MSRGRLNEWDTVVHYDTSASLLPSFGHSQQDTLRRRTGPMLLSRTIILYTNGLKAGEMEHCKNINMKIFLLQTSSLPDSMMVGDTDELVRAQAAVISLSHLSPQM